MKKLSILTMLFLFAASAQAQDTPDPMKVGDILVINEPVGIEFAHIHFPKMNFIIKRGGIANFKALRGEKVVIIDSETLSDGNRLVRLERKNGRKFFRHLKTVEADLELALAKGELRPLNPRTIQELAE